MTVGPSAAATVISSSQPARVDKNGLGFKIRIGPHGNVEHATRRRHGGISGSRRRIAARTRAQSQRRMRKSLDRWIDQAPRLECDREPLRGTYRRSLVDLAALRFSPRIAGGRSLPAAGLPWFMTMFGRDSILTSLQALPFTSELAATTLRALADWQGMGVDDFRDEDPGPDPARDAVRRNDRLRRAPALAVLRLRRRDAALRRPARRVRALDRRPRARARARGRGAVSVELDRRVRGSPGHRVHLVRAPQQEDRAREPVLEGLLGLDLVP